MNLWCERQPGESWRDAVRRIAGRHGLADECLAAFRTYLAQGMDEGGAAWSALNDWDCLEVERG